jgi:hypothetical protein
MKTRALLLALPVLALAGCQEKVPASVQIQAQCVPSDDCTFAETCGAQYIGFTTLDVGASALDRLWLVFQVGNVAEDTADPDTGRANTADAHIDQAVVEYEGIALPRQVLSLGALRVPAEGTSVITVEVIPDALNAASTLAAFAPTPDPREMLAILRLRGYFDDGSRFETAEYPIAVRICTGCVGVVCAGGATCPPASDGQLPIACAQ